MRMSDDWGSTWSDAIYLWDGGVLGSIESDTLIIGTDTITGFTNVFLQVSDSTIYATQTDLAAISDSTFVNATVTDTLFLAGDTITDVQKVTGAAGENYILSSKAYVDSTVSAAGGYTDEDAQDAIGAILDDGTLGDIIFTYTDATPTIHATVKDNSIVLPIDSITGLQDSLDARITAEVDGSVTNEGSLTVKAGTSSTSVISSNTSGSTDVTLSAGSNITLSETGNTITIASSGITSVTGVGSILTSGTSSAATVALKNDLTTPGNSKYYGTDASGTRGYHSLPSGVGDMTKAVYDADENNTIDVIRGGTGQSGYTTGDLLYASSTVTLAKLNAGTAGYVLTSNGAGVAPSWQAAGGGTSENFSVVSLSGTSVSWNMSNGINAKITLSGNTTITLSNVPTGRSGNLTVTNPSSTYTITFSLSGKTVKVSPFLNSSSGAITMSGGSKIDVLSWYYDGTYFIVNGTLDYD